MRIGILNLQDVDNYGCVLGAYGLLTVIGRMFPNAEAELIDYRPAAQKKTLSAAAGRAIDRVHYYGLMRTCRFYGEKISAKLRPQPEMNYEAKMTGVRAERFCAFRDHFLRRSGAYTALTPGDAPRYDTYLVGSDVVWLLEELRSGRDPDFLAFTDGMACRRVAYAASLGNMSAALGRRRSVQRLYRDGLARFDMISVREEASKAYLASLYPRDIRCCMDPTLLLRLQDYEDITAPDSLDRDYMYVYMLNETGDLYRSIDEISETTGLPIVRCCDQIDDYLHVIDEAEQDGPGEFLSRIRNAYLVITNSFHGVCFSILYHKNFFYVRRVIQAFKTEELLRKLGLMDRCVTAEELKARISAPIDYAPVDKRLDTWRNESMDYLRMALEKELP